MSRLFRRALSTFPPRAGPSTQLPSTLFPSASSVAPTLPLAVRRRRELFPPPKLASASPLSDPVLHSPNSPKPFPPALELDFRALVDEAVFNDSVTEPELRALFLKATQEWKSRVRGYAPRGKRGKKDFLLGVMGGRWAEVVAAEAETAAENARAEDEEPRGGQGRVVGQRIYLPNVQIRLMRNYTPPGQAYDPMVATFRIPPSMTKTDLRSYLHAVYDMSVSFIRTDNYIGQIKRKNTGRVERVGGGQHKYKRAVVGLTEPFHYPDDLEELYAQGELHGKGTAEADLRRTWLEEHFNIDAMEDAKKRAMMKVFKGYRWRSRTHNNAAHTIKAIMARRLAKEQVVYDTIDDARKEHGKRTLEALNAGAFQGAGDASPAPAA